MDKVLNIHFKELNGIQQYLLKVVPIGSMYKPNETKVHTNNIVMNGDLDLRFTPLII